MKISSVTEIKKVLVNSDKEDLEAIIFQLLKHSKENKELIHYLLFEKDFESNYVEKIREEIAVSFLELDKKNIRNTKKGLQKIVKNIKKSIKYSGIKTTEIEVLINFCRHMIDSKIPFRRYPVIHNIYIRQIGSINKAILTLHEDLQNDYNNEIEDLITYCSVY